MARLKPPLPPVRRYTLLRDGIEAGLRGFLMNDMDCVAEPQVDTLVDRASNRILIELGERFDMEVP